MPNKTSIPILIFLVTLIFYIYTLSPSLAWGDGVRLQSEVISGESFILSEMSANEFSPDPFPFAKVGITAWDHPLYIVLGHTLVKAFPSIDSLYLVNLISAVFGAVTVALAFQLSYQYTSYLREPSEEVDADGRAQPAHPYPHPEFLKRNTIPLLASLFVAFALAVSHTFWWHSTTPEVYTLLAFLLLSGLYWFDRFERTGNVSTLTASAFFFGLAGTNHILATLAAPGLVLYLLLSGKLRRLQRPAWRIVLFPALGFVTGSALFLLQFFRMTWSFTLSEVLGPVIGSTFLNGLGAFSPFVIAESLVTYLLFLIVQFGPVGIVFGAIGLRQAFDRGHPSRLKIFAFYIVYTVFGIFYRVTDQFAFFLMSHIFFALLMGLGVAHVLTVLQTRTRFVLSSVLLLTLVVTPSLYRSIPLLAKDNGVGDAFLKIPQIGTGLRDGLAYYIDPNKRNDFAAFEFGTQTITNLPPDALVIAEWYTDTDEYFILRHYSKVEPLRPDITVVGWPTEDPFSFDSQLTLDLIEATFPERPVYLASLSERFYTSSQLVETYCILPENNLYRLYQKAGGGLSCLKQDAVTE